MSTYMSMYQFEIEFRMISVVNYFAVNVFSRRSENFSRVL